MKVIFDGQYGVRDIAESSTLKQAFQNIQSFLKDKRYTPPYFRHWMEDGVITIDVGSHTEFFKIYECSKLEYEQFVNITIMEK